jgi:mono/diheme cytochrome c family protein
MKSHRWAAAARFAAIAVACCVGSMPHVQAESPPLADAAVLAKGEYLARASDCAACHTAPGRPDYAGGLAISSPVGTLYASNITPSKTAGIGLYTRDQFAAALRRGIRRDGANLYPVMPYTAYAVFTDPDIDALYAYFQHGVRPVESAAPVTSLPFPMNIRLSMMAWNLLFFQDRRFTPDPAQSEAWNRGKYLVEGAAHCSVCHTPRGFLMQERTSEAFGGGQVGAWYAPNITRDPTSGIGSWPKEVLIAYLRDGVAPDRARAGGTMAEAVEHSFQYLATDDLGAIATFIQTVPSTAKVTAPDRFTIGQPGSQLAQTRGVAATADDAATRGAVLFQGNCNSCHGAFGQGTRDGSIPALFKNSVVGADNSNLVATILNGIHRTTAHGEAFMPGFGGGPRDVTHLSDHEIALLATYVRGQYGETLPSVTDRDVTTVRQGGPSSPLILIARLGIGLGAALMVILATVLLLRRRGRRSPKSASTV